MVVKKGYIDMKKAEEYVNDFWGKIPETCLISEYDIKLVIKYAQIDAIKSTVQACADNADADMELLGDLARESIESGEPFLSEEDYEVYVIKSSILEVADKLIKELE